MQQQASEGHKPIVIDLRNYPTEVMLKPRAEATLRPVVLADGQIAWIVRQEATSIADPVESCHNSN